MTSLLTELAAHQRRGNTLLFAFGTMDCSMWAADWVRLRTGLDPAADWRGRYSTEDEYRRLLLAEGGLVRVVARAMQRVGARVVAPAEAAPGDIGIIMTEKGPACAIRGQLGWDAKTGDRLSRTPHATFAWRI
ncbi:hypothetical protein [Inquilinus sp.]|uniref:DUF6950 family protein n=1 Tax=Inquilinus sp. TaxID=1932117 RepID=UPI0031CF500F